MKRAFTMIELLVVMSLSTLLAGTGLYMSLQNARKQVVEQAAEKLQSAISQARSNALAGISRGCAGVFGGWQVRVLASSYVVEPVCDGQGYSSQTQSFNDVAFTTGTILFAPKGGGTTPVNLEISNSSNRRIIAVSSTGNITNPTGMPPTPTYSPLPTPSGPPVNL